MSEQDRSSNLRTYRMRKRADDVAATRQRIVEAAVRLHGTIGPAATTVSALAAEAGVTRLTVYRHFPDDRTLFEACSAHWAASQVPPDPQAWGRIRDPALRLRTGLADLYRFYRDAEPMLTRVGRDRDVLPSDIQERSAAGEARICDQLLKPFAARGSRRRKLRGLIGHATSFWTWRSLCLDHGLSNDEAVEAMTAFVCAVR